MSSTRYLSVKPIVGVDQIAPQIRMIPLAIRFRAIIFVNWVPLAAGFAHYKIAICRIYSYVCDYFVQGMITEKALCLSKQQYLIHQVTIQTKVFWGTEEEKDLNTLLIR